MVNASTLVVFQDSMAWWCRSEREARQAALDEASSRLHAVSASLKQLQGQHAELQAHAAALQGGLQSCREALELSQQACASAEVRAP